MQTVLQFLQSPKDVGPFHAIPSKACGTSGRQPGHQKAYLATCAENPQPVATLSSSLFSRTNGHPVAHLLITKHQPVSKL